ncbi:hypothetical protein ACFVZH_38480 [Streptomyces sp. NPDC059534]|uniref:hypothetical protein n=1 Tax=Streptomyces sp. NPDC059534 TaxID=3346859 RepID=UPI0036C43F07
MSPPRGYVMAGLGSAPGLRCTVRSMVGAIVVVGPLPILGDDEAAIGRHLRSDRG